MEICIQTILLDFSSSCFSIYFDRSPNHRRRPKRSSINNNSLLSTVTTVHELMSFIIHKGSYLFFILN